MRASSHRGGRRWREVDEFAAPNPRSQLDWDDASKVKNALPQDDIYD